MPTEIAAHIAETAWTIEKQVGDLVAERDAIVSLESMKMEMPVESPDAGKVLENRYKEAEAVREGSVVAVAG